CFVHLRRAPRPTLFPSTTLFRSDLPPAVGRDEPVARFDPPAVGAARAPRSAVRRVRRLQLPGPAAGAARVALAAARPRPDPDRAAVAAARPRRQPDRDRLRPRSRARPDRLPPQRPLGPGPARA